MFCVGVLYKFRMFPLVSNFVLSFQLFISDISHIFYLILTAIQFQFSIPLLGCCLLKFIYSVMILKEINITERSELLSFDFPKVQMYDKMI